MRYLKNSSYLANMDRSYSFLIFKEEDKDLSQVKLKMKQSSRTAEEILEEQRRLKVKKQQLKNKKSLSISNIGMVDQEL